MNRGHPYASADRADGSLVTTLRAADDVPLPSDSWLDDAVPLVTAAINTLVHEFAHHPYLHRVEHSLHVRLYTLLVTSPLFSGLIPIGDSGRFTQPVHKEWPETKAQPAHGRGNFDLVILSSDQLAGATLDQFRAGRIPAGIAIELGLDYDLNHLQRDRHKLVHSEVPHGYLVDFSRTGRGRPDIVEWVADLGDGGPEVAYAHHALTLGTVAVHPLGPPSLAQVPDEDRLLVSRPGA